MHTKMVKPTKLTNRPNQSKATIAVNKPTKQPIDRQSRHQHQYHRRHRHHHPHRHRHSHLSQLWQVSTSSSTYHTSAVDLMVEKNIYRNGIDVAAFNGYWYNGFVADYFGCGTFNRPATIERTLLPASHQPRSGIFNLKSSSKRAGQQKSNASFKNQKQSNWQNVNVIKRW